eukprot:489673_1
MCTPVIIAISSIFTLFILLALITIYYAFYVVCNNNKDKISLTAKIWRYIFILATSFVIGYYPIMRWQSCFDYNDYQNVKKMNPLWFFAYGAQIIILNIIFFNKIVNIFQETALKIKKAVQNIYKTLFIFQGITLFLLIILIVLRVFVKKKILQSLYSKLIAVILVLSLLIMISLSVLFVRRVLSVYKTAMKEQHKDENIIGTVTKATVLILISTSITFFHTVIFFLYTSKKRTDGSVQQLTARAIGNYIGFIDCYSNFVIAMLFSRSFGDFYGKMCAFTDRKCRICWLRIIHKDCCTDFNEWSKNNIHLQSVVSHSTITHSETNAHKSHSEMSTESKDKSQTAPTITANSQSPDFAHQTNTDQNVVI